MAPINYRYFVRGQWAGPADERPAITGAKFLKTLDALSGIDPLFTGWQFTGRWQIPEGHRSSFVPLASGRKRIVEIVKSGVYMDDFNKPRPEYGHSVIAVAGSRGPRHVAFAASTSRQSFDLSFGEHNIASDLSIVTYPLFKAALLAISSAWDANWAYAHACRNDVAMVPIDFGPGVPAFRVDSAPQVPLDPSFPKSIFHIPWIVYLSAERAAGVALTREVLTERTHDGGLLVSATTERLDPTNPEHVRRARILAEIMIARTGYSSK
jgi:Immunity protein 52